MTMGNITIPHHGAESSICRVTLASSGVSQRAVNTGLP